MNPIFKAIALIALFFTILVALTRCGDSSSKTTTGSMDTGSVNKAGGPPITDTGTITAQRKANKADSLKGDTTAKGNVDPKGYTNKK